MHLADNNNNNKTFVYRTKSKNTILQLYLCLSIYLLSKIRTTKLFSFCHQTAEMETRVRDLDSSRT